MAKNKACKGCKTIYTGEKCPKCFSKEFTDSFKGRVYVLNLDESQIAKNLELKDKGVYAIRLR
jgi:DNA-directed RNA polymerase subunit E"